MSRIGKKPIVVPNDVKVALSGNHISVQGPKGKLERNLAPGIKVVLEAGNLLVSRPDDERQSRADQGLVRALVHNMIKGVHEGFQRGLNISGVGYKAELKGRTLLLNLGYSHPVEYVLPVGIDVTVDKNVKVLVKGSDIELVGLVAAKIRSFRKPNPYKAKGITYEDEVIRHKAGKKAVGTVG